MLTWHQLHQWLGLEVGRKGLRARECGENHLAGDIACKAYDLGFVMSGGLVCIPAEPLLSCISLGCHFFRASCSMLRTLGGQREYDSQEFILNSVPDLQGPGWSGSSLSAWSHITPYSFLTSRGVTLAVFLF